MAVIGHKTRGVLLTLAFVMASAAHLRADDSADVHKVIGDVAIALSSGNAALAMTSFSKSYVDYDKLSDDFDALSGAYHVESQISFTDEDVSSSTATVTIGWAMTLTTLQSGITSNRNADITLKLTHEGKKWRIVAFGPIGIFDPQGP